jgi:hypothetical protein
VAARSAGCASLSHRYASLPQLESRIGVPPMPHDDPAQLSRELVSENMYYHRQLLVIAYAVALSAPPHTCPSALVRRPMARPLPARIGAASCRLRAAWLQTLSLEGRRVECITISGAPHGEARDTPIAGLFPETGSMPLSFGNRKARPPVSQPRTHKRPLPIGLGRVPV